MKALWITERFPPQKGGVAASAARQVGLLAPELDRLDVLHLTAELPPGRVVTTSFQGADIHRLGRAANDDESLQVLLETALNLARVGKHDLVHGFYAVWAGYVAVLAARRLGLPSAVSLRGNDVDRGMFQGSRLPFLLWTLENAAALACVSAEMMERVRALCGRKEGLRLVPNGVDDELFSPGEPAPETLSIPPAAPRPWIAFFGELRFKKGLPLLLELADDLARRGGGTLFAVGGVRADDKAHVDSWRRTSPEASRRLVEIPYLRDMKSLVSHYRAMDLVVFPSLWDGVPNALLEAMSCARPVLAARSGGIADVVEDGVSGRLVAPEDLDRFAEETHRLCALPPADRARLGLGARERVSSLFHLRAEQEALLRLYRSLLR